MYHAWFLYRCRGFILEVRVIPSNLSVAEFCMRLLCAAQDGLRYLFQTESKYVCLMSGTGHAGAGTVTLCSCTTFKTCNRVASGVQDQCARKTVNCCYVCAVVKATDCRSSLVYGRLSAVCQPPQHYACLTCSGAL